MNKTQPTRNWHLIDAQNQTLGRLATKIAKYLQGKHKTGYLRHVDNGDYVVVLNSEKIGVTGNKESQKTYERYSGYPKGGHKVTILKHLRSRKPAQILQEAVIGMLPKNKLKAKFLKRLKLVVGDQHKFQSQLSHIEK